MSLTRSAEIKNDISEESGILAPSLEMLTPANNNRFVYPVILWVGYGALFMELLFAGFVYNHTKDSLEYSGKMAGISPELTSKLVISPAILIAFLDLITNLTLMDAHTEAKNWETNLPQGFIIGIIEYIKKIFGSCNHFLTLAIPSMAMAYAFTISGYANVEPYQPFLNEHLGLWHLIPLGIGLFLSAAFFTLSMSKDTLNGVDFILNRNKALLFPPQPSLLSLFYHGDFASKATVLQICIEASSAIFNRSVFCAFLAAQMLAQANCENQAISLTLEITAALTSLITFGFGRWPASYKKYLGSDKRFDLVTTNEREEAYEKKYGNMSFFKFLSYEILRLLKSPLGIAESLLVGYFASYIPSLLYKIDFIATLATAYAFPDWISYCVSITPGLIFAASAYAFCRKAVLMRELNELALTDINVNLRINNVIDEASLDAEAGHQEPEEKMQIVPVSQCVNSIAVVTSFGKSASIVLNGHSFWMGVLDGLTNLTSLDLTVLSIASNTIVAKNGFDYVQPKVAQTIATITERTKESFNTLLTKARCCFFKPAIVEQNNQSASISVDLENEKIEINQSPIKCVSRCGIM